MVAWLRVAAMEVGTNGWIWDLFWRQSQDSCWRTGLWINEGQRWIKDGLWVCGLNNSVDGGAIYAFSHLFFTMILQTGIHCIAEETWARTSWGLGKPKVNIIGEAGFQTKPFWFQSQACLLYHKTTNLFKAWMNNMCVLGTPHMLQEEFNIVAAWFQCPRILLPWIWEDYKNNLGRY